MIAADAAGWYGLAGTLIATVGGVVVVLIQQRRLSHKVDRNHAVIDRVEQHVNNVEASVGPDGQPRHMTLRQAVDEGFARNDVDHQRLIERIVDGETHDAVQDGRLDILDREIGA